MKGIQERTQQIAEMIAPLPLSVEVTSNDRFEMIEQAVKATRGKAKLEVSGNMTIETLQEYSKAGVDYISSGA